MVLNAKHAIALVVLALGPLTACTAASDAPQNQTVTVFAAASLTDTFTELGKDFEAANPGIKVVFSFAGSADLATQIVEGAPADVFASANEAQMDVVSAESLTAAAPMTFATNILTIIVPSDNPANISSFEDLASADVATVVCAPQVPCGAATVTLEDKFGFDIPAVSEENSVTDVLGKVSSGQSDAGVVYVTDVPRSTDITAIPIEGAEAAINTYPIASLRSSQAADAASAFVDYVTGAEGAEVLTAAGFGTP